MRDCSQEVEMEIVRKHGRLCNQWVTDAGFCRRPSKGLYEERFAESCSLLHNGHSEE